MLKRTINYTDFDGNNHSEVFYFNMSKSELIELDVSHKSGFAENIQRIIAAEDRQALIAEFKNLILVSYGVRSEDGKRFVKSDELRNELEQSAAYDALFMELATNDQAAAEFINGVIPQELRGNAPETKTPSLPPPPPAA